MRGHSHVRIPGGWLRDGGLSVSALQRPIAALLLVLWSALIASGPASAQEPATPATLEPIPGLPCGGPGLRCCGEADAEDFDCLGDYSTCSSGGLCAECGRPGQRCCPGDRCNTRAACTPGGFCELTCGRRGLPCCDFGCDYSDICFDGVCSGCGGAEQPCCDGGECFAFSTPGFLCDDETNRCLPANCGEEGQACCAEEDRPGRTCNLGVVCVAGTCDRCGFDGLACCAEVEPTGPCRGGGECGADSVCVGGSDAPPPPPPPPPSEDGCGFNREPCCRGRSCGARFLCIDSICEPCGGDSEPCCRDDYCAGDYVCGPTSNLCLPEDRDPCGQPGQRCCTEADGFDECNARARCIDDLCVSCGPRGEICCEGDVCVAGASLCTPEGVCSGRCGFDGLQCCDGGECARGRECDTETDTCSSLGCGLEGQPCCTPAILMMRGPQCEFARDCIDGICGVRGAPLPPPTDPPAPMPAPPPEPMPAPPLEPMPAPPPDPMPAPPPEPMLAPSPDPMPAPPPEPMPAPPPEPMAPAPGNPKSPGKPPFAFPPFPETNFPPVELPPRTPGTSPKAPRRPRPAPKFRCRGEDCKDRGWEWLL